MKSIVFIIESLHLGGSEKSLVTLLQNLDFKKYSVDLIIFSRGGIFEQNIPKDVNVIYDDTFSKISFTDRILYKSRKILNPKKLHDSQILWDIIRKKFENRNKKYDVAISYSQGFTSFYTEAYVTAELKFSWVNIDYSMAGYNLNYDLPIYKQYHSIVAVSPQVKDGLLHELTKLNESLRIDVIKDITDRDEIHRKSQDNKKVNFDDKKINIVTACRLAKQKGLHLAVEACKILVEKKHPVHWYLVGEGGERKFLQELISTNKLDDHITLVGMTDNPYPYMKDCDIYVQTSLFEGLGLTVIEASYLCKPIVSTNFPTVFGILKDGETGLIAEMNSKSILEKIELIITDETLKDSLVNNLSKSTNSDKEQTLQKFENLINNRPV